MAAEFAGVAVEPQSLGLCQKRYSRSLTAQAPINQFHPTLTNVTLQPRDSYLAGGIKRKSNLETLPDAGRE